jgi:hypothetical protein
MFPDDASFTIVIAVPIVPAGRVKLTALAVVL